MEMEQCNAYIFVANIKANADLNLVFSGKEYETPRAMVRILLEQFTQVHRVYWHMLHDGGPTPKRHWAVANSKHISRLWRGKLTGWKNKSKEEREKKSTTIKYVDKAGKARYKGSKNLKKSENGP